MPDVPTNEVYLRLLEGVFFRLTGCLVRRRCYAEVGLFDPAMIRSEDYDMQLRLARRFSCVYIGVPTMYARQHDGPRGSLRDFHSAAERNRKHLAYDRLVTERALRHLSLADFLPYPSEPRALTPLQRRHAFLQRQNILMRKGFWDEALRDLREAMVPDTSGTPLSEAERRICLTMLGEPIVFENVPATRALFRDIRQICGSRLGREARVVVGARSALYLPYPDLGLIVVDEEHDGAFKQEDRVTYQGRDMAVVRASLGGIPIVLASATPSLESQVNARTGRYRHLKLESRFSGQALPEITAIDLKREAPERGTWLAPRLVEEVATNLAKGEQSLLFLNRRGYAPLTLCRACGHRFQCPQCSAWLVEHRFRGRLTCHHCGFSTPVPEKCPKCGVVDSLAACGPGVERITEEVKARFPEARTAILSSDLVPGIIELRKLIDDIAKGSVDIIIGTQIVAKGHNFPGLTLVGIVDADLGLSVSGDPRASERTFQLLHQVTGRAGRHEKAGRGFLQTHLPEHPVMQAIVSGDREAFLDYEIAARQEAGYPPFGRLASLIVSAKHKPTAEELARLIALRAPPAQRISVLGPAEAPIAVVRGRHRFRILLKAPKEVDVQAYLRAWLATLPPLKGDVRLQVDIDPYNFM